MDGTAANVYDGRPRNGWRMPPSPSVSDLRDYIGPRWSIPIAVSGGCSTDSAIVGCSEARQRSSRRTTAIKFRDHGSYFHSHQLYRGLTHVRLLLRDPEGEPTRIKGSSNLLISRRNYWLVLARPRWWSSSARPSASQRMEALRCDQRGRPLFRRTPEVFESPSGDTSEARRVPPKNFTE